MEKYHAHHESTYVCATAHNVKRSLRNSVPVEQRAVCGSLRLRSNMNGMEIVAYYDEDVFCGFACLLATEKRSICITSPLPMTSGIKATEPKFSTMKQRYPEKTIALDIEAHDPRANDNEKRAARRAFYLKNGFKPRATGSKTEAFSKSWFSERSSRSRRHTRCLSTYGLSLTHTNVRPMSEVKSKSRK
ncbi:MAG: hypothetical protein ACLT98_01255 [Eggerthellaceae bacterium]